MTDPIGPPAFGPMPFSAATGRAPTEARRLRTNDEGKLRNNLDAKGRLERASAVENGVSLSLSVKRGGIPSAPRIGNDLHLVTPDLPTTQLAVEDAVNRSYPLSEYLAQGRVQTIEIRHESRPHGGLLVEYTYREIGSNQSKRFSTP
jgi:hypothetical protein